MTPPPPAIKKFIEEKVLNPNCEEESVDQKALRAFFNTEAGKFAVAENELREVIQADPNFLKPYYFLARLYNQRKSVESALEVSNELLKRMELLHTRNQAIEDYAWYYAQRAGLLVHAHDFVNSQKCINKALAIRPGETYFLRFQPILDGFKKDWSVRNNRLRKKS